MLFTVSIFKQEKISKANVEIETKDYIYYSYKETIKINSCKHLRRFDVPMLAYNK